MRYRYKNKKQQTYLNFFIFHFEFPYLSDYKTLLYPFDANNFTKFNLNYQETFFLNSQGYIYETVLLQISIIFRIKFPHSKHYNKLLAKSFKLTIRRAYLLS